MGLPELTITFKKLAETAVKRSGNGVVALILTDTTKQDVTTYSYGNENDIVKSHWSTANLNYLNLAFLGNPKKVIVERVQSEEEYDDAKARLGHKKWNYLAIPGITEEKVSDISAWIIGLRKAGKTYKAVLPNSESDNIGIINYTTDENSTGTKTYTTAEYCARIAGLLAGIPLNRSATGEVLSDLVSVKESTTPDDDIDAGKFILINDGEHIEVARSVNSLTTLDDDHSEDMKSIKIVEGMDLMADDIQLTFKENYKGGSNSLDNKELFIAACNQYFTTLVTEGVLYDGYDHYAEIDVAAQREWLSEKYNVSDLTDAEIKKQNTGKLMFMAAHVQMQDAVEDMRMTIYI